QMTLLREEQVEVEVDRQPFVELDARLVELSALAGSVVRADDRGVATGGARADVALLEDGDVGDAVVLGEVVGRGETVRAPADDDDVVAPLELAARAPHPRRPDQLPDAHVSPAAASMTTSAT